MKFVDLLKKPVELLELVHPGELESRVAQPLEPHDLEREPMIRGRRAFVGQAGLDLQQGLELIGDDDAGERVRSDVAGAPHRQEHQARHDGSLQAAPLSVGNQLFEFQHVPPDLGDETVHAHVLLLRHLDVLIHQGFFPVLERRYHGGDVSRGAHDSCVGDHVDGIVVPDPPVPRLAPHPVAGDQEISVTEGDAQGIGGQAGHLEFLGAHRGRALYAHLGFLLADFHAADAQHTLGMIT